MWLRFLLGLALAGLAWAQPLTLDEAQQQAHTSHPGLARLRARVQEAQAKGQEAASAGNPRIELGARYTYLTPELAFALGPTSMPLVVHHNYSSGIVLEQAIATFGRLHWSKQAAEMAVQALEQEYQRESQRLSLLVALAYSRLHTSQEAIEVARQAIASREQLLSDLEKRLQVGVSARYELLVAQVALGQDEQRLLQARQQSRLALTQLVVLVGLPKGTIPEVEALPLESLQLPEVGQAVEMAGRQRAELKAIDFAIDAAQAKIHLEESQMNPSLGFQTRYEARNSTAFQTPHQWSAGLEFRWPLYDGGITAARTAQAEAARIQLSESRREIERQIRLEVEESLLKCETARQGLEVSVKNQQAAQEALRLAGLRFKAGVGTHQETLDAQARFREAQQQVLESQQMVRESAWQLNFALGL